MLYKAKELLPSSMYITERERESLHTSRCTHLPLILIQSSFLFNLEKEVEISLPKDNLLSLPPGPLMTKGGKAQLNIVLNIAASDAHGHCVNG